jgi:hypothetical protein
VDAFQALSRCRAARCRVRPVTWRTAKPGRYIEARTHYPGRFLCFAEGGPGDDVPFALGRLTPEEWAGPWEVLARNKDTNP